MSNQLVLMVGNRKENLVGFTPLEYVSRNGGDVLLFRERDRDWRQFVLTFYRNEGNGKGGKFWQNFNIILGYFLHREGYGLDFCSKMSILYSSQYAVDRINDSGLRRVYMRMKGEFVWHTGEDVQVGGKLDVDRMLSTHDEWLKGMYMSMLWCMGILIAYPLGVGDEISKSFDVVAFNNMLMSKALDLGYMGKGILTDYLYKYLGKRVSLSPEGLRELSKGSDGKGGGITLSRAIEQKIKNMSKWTEDDFWKEMTELYYRCKSDEDVKSVKSILELKAKTMGLLNEVQPVNNNIVVLTDKAVQALAQFGFVGKRSIGNG